MNLRIFFIRNPQATASRVTISVSDTVLSRSLALSGVAVAGATGATSAIQLGFCEHLVTSLVMLIVLLVSTGAVGQTPSITNTVTITEYSGRAEASASLAQLRHAAAYQVFAVSAVVPAMTAVDNGVLQIGEKLKIDTKNYTAISTNDQQTLADLLEVPMRLIDRVWERSFETTSEPQNFVKELRAAVIDYGFLLSKWNEYRPTAAGQPSKATALRALASGDLLKAADLYAKLQKPPPPSGLRILAP
jgi:hypothetical protein